MKNETLDCPFNEIEVASKLRAWIKFAAPGLDDLLGWAADVLDHRTSKWINDRLPTEDDVDGLGNVVVLEYDGEKYFGVMHYWEDIIIGESWAPLPPLDMQI